MVLNNYRSKADKVLIPISRAFSGLHPNTISAVSLLFAFLAGIALTFSNYSRYEDTLFPGHYVYIMFAIASVCIFLNGFFDAVDGKVAKMTNRASKRGDLFDHTLDRYADILILGGIMLSPYCETVIGALAIIAVLMTSYMGTQAQALGCGRNYSGLLGRADRMAILIIVPVIQMGILYYFSSAYLPIQYIETFTILEWVMIWFIIAGNITAIHRGVHSWRELRDQEVNNTKTGEPKYHSLSRESNETETQPVRIKLIKNTRQIKETTVRTPIPNPKESTRHRSPHDTNTKHRPQDKNRELQLVTPPRTKPTRDKKPAKPKPRSEMKQKAKTTLKLRNKSKPKLKGRQTKTKENKSKIIDNVRSNKTKGKKTKNNAVPKANIRSKTKKRQKAKSKLKKIETGTLKTTNISKSKIRRKLKQKKKLAIRKK